MEFAMGREAKQRSVRANSVLLVVLMGIILVVATANLFSGIVTSSVVDLTLSVLLYCFVIVGTLVFYVLLHRRNSRARLIFGDGTYTSAGYFRTDRFSVAEAVWVVTVDQMSRGIAGPTEYLFVVGHHQVLLTLVGRMWDRDQLGSFALDLANRGVPLTPVHQPITPAQLRAWDSRLVPPQQSFL